jgi:signal peptidase I
MPDGPFVEGSAPSEVRPVPSRWPGRGRVEVRDESMLPTLRPGDRLHLDRRGYRTHPPRAGDIVVVVDPEGPTRWVVKRVAAVGPGTWWRAVGGLRPAAPGDVRPADAVEAIHLPSGALWVLGDNSERSRDSRHFGPVARAAVVGRVFECYAPSDRRRVW